MQSAAPEISICPGCGRALEETSGGGRGCMVCLLRVGIGGEDDISEKRISKAFESDERFGVYEIDRREDGSFYELGHGAMGVTYRATDTSLQRKVALKVIKLGVATAGTEARERFLREARAAAALRHENIATVFQFGIREETGQLFYAMELIEGETLEERVRRAGPLGGRATIDIAQQVTAALIAAEKRGLIHRDLKPANLMLVEPDEPEVVPRDHSLLAVARTRGERTSQRAVPILKIIDFGLAKVLNAPVDPTRLTHDGFVGTPAFASPEQFENSALDVRSDIYSLGATLWFALTGKTPFEGYPVEEIRRAQKSNALPLEQLKAARVPSSLRSLLESMLAREPAARPGTHDLAARLRRCAAKARPENIQGTRVALAAAAILILSASAFLVSRSLRTHPATAGSISSPAPPEKSIAVLPFENRSEEKENAYFADGVQDEILTRLSKIADLKVISRTSTQHYKSAPGNLPEVARQLGVAHILEGTVQKRGDTVRVNVQLIKAANDSHLWAETFDRKLTDIFSVESEVAKAIAEQLRAHLTGQEEQVITAKPTENTEAYDAYLRGLAFTLRGAITPSNALEAQKYLREAVRLDPKFALAWALLSNVEARGYVAQALQPTVALREEARQAVETALTLQPNLGEAVLAKGYYHYGCLKDYDTAVRYFEQARQFLPNSSRIAESLAYVTRRRGHWDQSENYFNEAERLDPRNVNLFAQHALSYAMLRRFPEALRKFDQVLNITPDDVDTLAEKAAIAQAEGDLPHASALLAPLHPAADLNQALETQVYQAILERRTSSVIPRLKEILATPNPALGYINGELRFWLAWAQEVGGDHAAARESWLQARSELEPLLKKQPENDRLIGDLALTNMGLGEKAAALALVERAMAVNPIEKDAMTGPVPIEILARVTAQMGEPDRAVAALQKLLSIPYGGLLTANVPLTPALLRLDPTFDPLRSDPRFQELCKDKQQIASELVEKKPLDKSIAVLPFENLSDEKEHTFFAEGVHDDILTKLAKIADLKVISRTSVMQYRGNQDLRQIAAALGVSHVLEGTVRRSDGKVHVNAQLIDARTDTHVWAEEYDRDLNDVFAVESELAQSIANHLRATVTGREKLSMQERPTSDLVAFDLYTRAKSLVLAAASRSSGRTELLEAVDLLNQAIARDPSFLQAYCQLASAHEHLYSLNLDHTSARLASAEAAIQTAFRLRPDAGEVHFARAENFYRGHQDYRGALAELEIAGQTLPNDMRVFQLMGYVQRRQGHWEEATQNLERAVTVDPGNTHTLLQMAWQYLFVRRYAEVKQLLARALAIESNRVDMQVLLASVDFHWRGDIRPFHQMIDSIRTTNPSALPAIADAWLTVALVERDPREVVNATAAAGENAFGDDTVQFSRTFVEALVARMMKDEGKARAAFTAARSEQEKIVRTQPNYGPPLCVLGLIDAALGRKKEALREGGRAVELLPVEKDAINGVRMIKYLAMIAAWADDKDLACEQLAAALRYPTSPSYGELKLLPFWDPLRGDPRFEQIVSSLAPR